jgi:site-specific DNA recombinase
VFEDEGLSVATLQRPALERLSDRGAEGAFEVAALSRPGPARASLCLPGAAARGTRARRCGRVLREGARARRHARGRALAPVPGHDRRVRARADRRAHPTREAAPRAQRLAGGDVRRVLRIPLRQEETDHCDAYWEIDELEAQTLRDVFARYAQDATSIGELACWLTERGVPTRTGKTVWDRSTIWAMLRNPAIAGRAAFGKTKTAARHGAPTRTTRARGARHGRRLTATTSRPRAGRWSRCRRSSARRRSSSRRCGWSRTRASPGATPRS